MFRSSVVLEQNREGTIPRNQKMSELLFGNGFLDHFPISNCGVPDLFRNLMSLSNFVYSLSI